MAFENRHYVIIPTSEINRVDFTEVLETSAETVRLSIDGTKTFVKYEGNLPASIAAISNKNIEYTHSEILEILSTAEWSTSDQEIM